jgi:4-amino-4-deoxy-L-arabinose transferase-like glycosyltransferase
LNVLKNNYVIVFLIALSAGFIFIPFIGNCNLFDWDEVNFAECAREMVVSKNYSQVQINYRPFWEKPPFFIWLQAAAMNIFGINEFAARLPNAICGIFTLVSLFIIGNKFHSQKFGIVWVLMYAATILPHLYFKSGIIDPWFNLFIFLSIYNCILFINNIYGKREALNALLAGIFLGLAVITKGPAAIVIVGLTLLAYLFWNKKVNYLVSKNFLLFVFSSIISSGAWFLIETLRGNSAIVIEFINYQIRLLQTEDSSHGGPFIYHFVVLILGCFPVSFIFLLSFKKYSNITPFQKNFKKIMSFLFWIVLLLFSIVKTKIVHYSSLCYFPLTFLSALVLIENFDAIKFRKYLSVFYWVVAGSLSILFMGVSFINLFKNKIINSSLINDPFARMNLTANVNWSGLEWLIGLLLLGGCYFIFIAIQRKKFKLLYYGFILNLAFIYFSIHIIVPKVEGYTQNSAIQFYKFCAIHPCYLETVGFKSYAYLFYSERKPKHYNVSSDQKKMVEKYLDEMEKEGLSRFQSYPGAYRNWMLYAQTSVPVYLITKTTEEKNITNPLLKKLYNKNGFSFYIKMPEKPAK